MFKQYIPLRYDSHLTLEIRRKLLPPNLSPPDARLASSVLSTHGHDQEHVYCNPLKAIRFLISHKSTILRKHEGTQWSDNKGMSVPTGVFRQYINVTSQPVGFVDIPKSKTQETYSPVQSREHRSNGNSYTNRLFIIR